MLREGQNDMFFHRKCCIPARAEHLCNPWDVATSARSCARRLLVCPDDPQPALFFSQLYLLFHFYWKKV